MDRFVVGTGRCGSTLLSRMLAEHPRTLSLFEFFNGIDAARRFAPDPVSGKAFAELIAAEQPFVTAVLRRGYRVPEIVYPFGEGGRHEPGEPLPWILVSLLPRLTDDPDALFDASMDLARSLPEQPVPAHCRALFAWLGARTGRAHWVERSGSSIEYLEDLARVFPEARFLHLHRDGPETALSMRGHHAYRLPISLLYGAPLDSGKSLSELGPLDLHATPSGSDPISQILASRPPAHYFGRYWCDQVVRGFRALARIDPARVMTIAFEDLLERAEPTLLAIESFFELGPGGDWRECAAGLVDGAPPLRAPSLADDEREALERACRAGQQLVGRVA